MWVIRGIGIFFIILAIVLAIMVVHLDHAKRKEFNNGICPKCGRPYRFVQAVGHRTTTSYIYMCDHCNKLLEMDKYMGGLMDDETEQ